LKYLRYDKVEARIVRQFERLGIKSEDPENYSVCYGNSLLDTQQLLTQARELGITEDLVCHPFLSLIILYFI
jgi:hypothetical protein